MTKIYRTHGSHKVQKAQPEFVCMGHTGHDDRDRSLKGYIWFETDVMRRRSITTHFYIYDMSNVEGGVRIRILGFDIREPETKNGARFEFG